MALSSNDFKRLSYQAIQARTRRPEPRPPQIQTRDGFLYVDGERFEGSDNGVIGDVLDVSTDDYHVILVLGTDLNWHIHKTTALPQRRDRTSRRI